MASARCEGKSHMGVRDSSFFPVSCLVFLSLSKISIKIGINSEHVA